MKPAKLGRPSRIGLGQPIREIKMLRPMCQDSPEHQGCQNDPSYTPFNWFKACIAKGHDPYYSTSTRIERRPITEAGPDGRILVRGYEEEMIQESAANLVQVALSERVGGSRSEYTLQDRKRRRGFILPEEHPTAPLAHFCEYRDCWSQDIQNFTSGRFCREEEAKLVQMEVDSTIIEVFNPQVRRRQMAQVAVR